MDKKFWIAGFIIIAILIGGYYVLTSIRTINIDEINPCDSNDDCILVASKHCCSCGGVAINKNYLNTWNRVRGDICMGVACEMCPSFSYEAICFEGRCTKSKVGSN